MAQIKLVVAGSAGRMGRALIESVMTRANGNQTQAADMLGMNRNTLRAKLTKYHIR